MKPFKILLLWLTSFALAGCFTHDKPVKSWNTSEKGILSGNFSRDGQYAVIGSEDQGGALWNINQAESQYGWNHSKDVYSFVIDSDFSSDSRYALTADPTTLVLWDVLKGSALNFLDAPADIRLIQLSADANYALLALDNQSLVYFDIQRGGLLHNIGFEHNIVAIALSDNNRYAVVSTDDKLTRILDLRSGTINQTITTDGRVRTVIFSHDSERLFMSGSRVKPGIWNVDSGSRVTTIGKENRIYPGFPSYLSAVFSKDDKLLLTGDASGQVQLWNTENGKRQRQWLMPKSAFWLPKSFAVIAVAINDDTQRYYAMTSGGATHILE